MVAPAKAILFLLATALAAPSQQDPDSSDSRCPAVLQRILTQSRSKQRAEVRSFLQDIPDNDFDSNCLKLVFEAQDVLRPHLGPLKDDSKVGELAHSFLMLFGEKVDQKMVAWRLSRTTQDSDNDWLHAVVTSMLDPKSESDWTLLRKSALGAFDNNWVDYGAIQTLKLIASPRSRRILEEVRKVNHRREQRAAQAIAYIDSHPEPLQDVDLTRLAARVAQAVKIGEWEENQSPVYNQRCDRAMVNSIFLAGRDRLTYSGTYRRQNGVWKLSGIGETEQALLPYPPPPQKR